MSESENTVLSATDAIGRNPLHLAAIHGNDALASALAQSNPSLASAKDQQGAIPLQLAVEYGHLGVVRALLAREVSADRASVGKALRVAAENGNVKAAELLIDSHPEAAELRDDAGYTPLHNAVYAGQGGIVDLLIRRQPLLALVRDNGGWTPLHVAALVGQTDIVRSLLENAPEGLLDIKNDRGQSAYDVAKRQHLAEVALLLERPKERPLAR